MHKSRLACLVIDCQTDDFQRDTAFWSAALGHSAQAAETLDANYAKLEVPGDELRVLLQRVDHPSRVHLDIETDDIPAEVARLETLGATVVDYVSRWCVMQAPSAHRFCVVNPQRADFEANATVWA